LRIIAEELHSEHALEHGGGGTGVVYRDRHGVEAVELVLLGDRT
jgi:hypothetical protein